MTNAILTFISATDNSAILKYNVNSDIKLPDIDNGIWEIIKLDTSNPSFQFRTMQKINTSYDKLKYSWDFGEENQSGEHTFEGLKSGIKNTIKAELIISCEEKTITYQQEQWSTNGISWEPELKEENGVEKAETKELDKVEVSFDVFTKPTAFAWSSVIAANQIIELNLKASDWNILVDRAEQKANWMNQKDGADFSLDKVQSGDFITAKKYNSLAEHCGTDRRVQVNDLITADLFISL